MKPTLSIHPFTDYRAFLVAYAQEMKRAKRGWSYGAWAKALGLKATSSITKVIHGEREPGPEITEKLIRYFEFDRAQSEYFRDLIRLRKVQDDPRLCVLLMEKMGKDHPDGAIRILDDKAFAVISNWYCLPLRELVRMPSFKEDPHWIAKRLRFKATAREIKQALGAMESLGLLKRDADGRLRLAEGRLNTTDDVASEAIKRYHEQMLDHARDSLRSVPIEAREVTAASLVLSTANLPRAKAMIRDFRHQFARAFEEERGDAVYQVQIQLFPLTRTESRAPNPKGTPS